MICSVYDSETDKQDFVSFLTNTDSMNLSLNSSIYLLWNEGN